MGTARASVLGSAVSCPTCSCSVSKCSFLDTLIEGLLEDGYGFLSILKHGRIDNMTMMNSCTGCSHTVFDRTTSGVGCSFHDISLDLGIRFGIRSPRGFLHMATNFIRFQCNWLDGDFGMLCLAAHHTVC